MLLIENELVEGKGYCSHMENALFIIDAQYIVTIATLGKANNFSV